MFVAFKCDTKYCKCWLKLIGEVDLRHSAAAAAVACGHRGPGEAGGRGGGRPGLFLLPSDDGALQGPLLTRRADESLVGSFKTNTFGVMSPSADPAAETEHCQLLVCQSPRDLSTYSTNGPLLVLPKTPLHSGQKLPFFHTL